MSSCISIKLRRFEMAEVIFHVMTSAFIKRFLVFKDKASPI
jgi:hypothetical protein